MLIACHTASTTYVVMWSQEEPVTKTKPDVVLDYNIHKVGMNRSDQVTAYYPEIVENIFLSPIYN